MEQNNLPPVTLHIHIARQVSFNSCYEAIRYITAVQLKSLSCRIDVFIFVIHVTCRVTLPWEVEMENSASTD